MSFLIGYSHLWVSRFDDAAQSDVYPGQFTHWSWWVHFKTYGWLNCAKSRTHFTKTCYHKHQLHNYYSRKRQTVWCPYTTKTHIYQQNMALVTNNIASFTRDKLTYFYTVKKHVLRSFRSRIWNKGR